MFLEIHSQSRREWASLAASASSGCGYVSLSVALQQHAARGHPRVLLYSLPGQLKQPLCLLGMCKGKAGTASSALSAPR